MSIYQESGAEVIAEDLGTVPDFVRASLRRLGVPGFKVFRWERHWNASGQPFVDPAEYRGLGRHDGHARHRAFATWWKPAAGDRVALIRLPSVARYFPRPATATAGAKRSPRS